MELCRQLWRCLTATNCDYSRKTQRNSSESDGSAASIRSFREGETSVASRASAHTSACSSAFGAMRCSITSAPFVRRQKGSGRHETKKAAFPCESCGFRHLLILTETLFGCGDRI